MEAGSLFGLIWNTVIVERNQVLAFTDVFAPGMSLSSTISMPSRGRKLLKHEFVYLRAQTCNFLPVLQSFIPTQTLLLLLTQLTSFLFWLIIYKARAHKERMKWSQVRHSCFVINHVHLSHLSAIRTSPTVPKFRSISLVGTWFWHAPSQLLSISTLFNHLPARFWFGTLLE